MAQSREVRSQADSRAVHVLKEVADQAGADGDELSDRAKAALGRIFAYMAHAATKAGKCEVGNGKCAGKILVIWSRETK